MPITPRPIPTPEETTIETYRELGRSGLLTAACVEGLLGGNARRILDI